MCSYGAKYKKPTMILTNCAVLQGLESQGIHERRSAVLRGSVFLGGKKGCHSCSKTELAGAYPHELCKRWTQCVRHLLAHVSQVSGAAFSEARLRLVESATKQYGRPQFHLCQKAEAKCKGLLDTVAFGQHSRAQAEARSRQRKAMSSASSRQRSAATLKARVEGDAGCAAQ